jgi:tRNA-dihydrouridine synthase B
MNTLDSTREQLLAVNEFFDAQKALSDRLVYVEERDADGDRGGNDEAEESCGRQNHTDRLAA